MARTDVDMSKTVSEIVTPILAPSTDEGDKMDVDGDNNETSDDL